MAGLPDLLEVQLGTEATDAWGTAVAPSVKLMGIDEVTITPIKQSAQVGEIKGSLAPAFISIREMEEGAASIGGVITYQDFPYFLDALFGGALDSDDGGYATDANGTIGRTYNAPLGTFDTDLDAASSFTIVYGEGTNQATDVVSLTGGTLNALTVSASTGGASRFSADFLGNKVKGDTLGDLADRTVEVVMGDQWAIYIDPSTDAVGTTQLTNVAFSFELVINPNRALVRHLGNLEPDEYRDAKWNGSLSLSLELDTDSAAYHQSLITATTTFERVIRLEASTGTGATARRVRFDFNGVITSAPSAFTDADGVITVDLEFVGQYNSVLANWLIADSLNDIAALP